MKPRPVSPQKKAVTMPNDEEYRFAGLSKDNANAGAKNLATDPRLALLAVCIASQQSAGFKTYLDLREVPCRDCGASGFNTGWGYWRHECGAEFLSDGEESEPCPTPKGTRARRRK